MHDTIIRGAKIVDGLGGAPYSADIAISDGRIAEIGKVSGPAHRTIDADGAIVTPGFIDIHTHYDGQVLWDDRLDPSFSHGVTTVVTGNCGVGFAPVEQEHRQELMELMTGVEDIPGIVLEEGLDWKWRSFPDYLDRVAQGSYTMDVASHLTHAPLRVFVMGERALRQEEATADDLARMQALVREAMSAGAVGVSTGRIVEHRSAKGTFVPGTFAASDELMALASAMGESGRGVFQVAPKGQNGSLFINEGEAGRAERLAEHDLLEDVARSAGRPLTYGLVEVQNDPDDIHMMIDASEKSIARGIRVHPQITSRGGGQTYMLDGYHLFMLRPSYLEVAHLPLPQRLEALRNPARRAAILSESDAEDSIGKESMALILFRYIRGHNDISYILHSPLDFEPGPERQLAAMAAAASKTAQEYLYDYYTDGDGNNFNVNFVANYIHGNLETTRGMLANPNVISGLGDGGAHMRVLCDAALPTFQLAYWTKQRTRGACLPLELMVGKMTADIARLYGFSDRGSIEVGKRADLNVIDMAKLGVKLPRMVHDLPSGSGRLLQESEGYLATLVAGRATRIHNQDTGARPGRLIRSGQFA